jgi:hypothetical protein
LQGLFSREKSGDQRRVTMQGEAISFEGLFLKTKERENKW